MRELLVPAGPQVVQEEVPAVPLKWALVLQLPAMEPQWLVPAVVAVSIWVLPRLVLPIFRPLGWAGRQDKNPNYKPNQTSRRLP